MKYIAYYRVSTQKQGQSGLGLEAQRSAVLNYIKDNTLVAEFTEVESGKVNSRPELEQAMRHARVTGATLIVAKLDRLSRNAAFLNQLFDSKLSIICVDMPFADRFTIGIMAQVAQWEREQISSRTKAALQAAKARGRKLGGYRCETEERSAVGRARSRVTRMAQARAAAADRLPYINQARSAGRTTLRDIAQWLNDQHIEGPRGGAWYPNTVRRALAQVG